MRIYVIDYDYLLFFYFQCVLGRYAKNIKPSLLLEYPVVIIILSC